MTSLSLTRLPLETLLPFTQDGRVFRAFDHLILARVGALLLVPVWRVAGDLRRVIDGCPVPWEEVCDVLDAPALSVVACDPADALVRLSPTGWQREFFHLARRDNRRVKRLVHPAMGLRFAEV